MTSIMSHSRAGSTRPAGVGADPDAAVSSSTFAALVGMMDPPRSDVAGAVKRCRESGIHVVMITGDHPDTARTIAGQVGILGPEGCIMTGEELDSLSDDELDRIVERIEIFARVTPSHKLRIVNSLRRAGQVVVKTGDGVNDSPAVKWADVGFAMGTGTDVTKEASSVVLVDDSFVTILMAVEEGRVIQRNIHSALEFLVTGNMGEVLFMTLAVVTGLPLSLIPIQILLVNLLTDALPAVGLAIRKPDIEAIKSRKDGQTMNGQTQTMEDGFYPRVIIRGLLTGLGSLSTYAAALFTGRSIVTARTMAFASIVGSQYLHFLHWPSLGLNAARWLRTEAFLRNTLGVSWLAILGGIYISPVARLFGLAPLGVGDWALVAAPAVASAVAASGDFPLPDGAA
ncbi:MAG: cation-translocating P-type ATPase [Firmicutes bacterium]|nr:cation-translocating P-type ATPase [Bacillota bacterium]